MKNIFYKDNPKTPKGVFSLNFIWFYILLLSSSIMIYFVGIKIIKGIVSDCNGMECLAMAPFVIILFIVLLGIIIVYNIALSIIYQVKNNYKHRYIQIIYFGITILLIVSIIIVPTIEDKYYERQHEKLMEKNENELKTAIINSGLEGCIEVYSTRDTPFTQHICFQTMTEFAKNGIISKNTSCESDFCKYNLAQDKNTSEYCYNMTYNSWKTECAKEFIDLKLCNSIQDNNSKEYTKKECYSGIIDLIEDSNKCKEIKDQRYKEICIMTNTFNPNDCFPLTLIDNEDLSSHLSYRDTCIYNVSEKINLDANKNAYIDICFNISDNRLKDYCISNLAQDLSDCKLITPDNRLLEMPKCISTVAVNQKNIELCNKIDSNFSIDEYNCIVNYSNKTNMPFCEVIKKSEYLTKKYTEYYCKK